MSSPVPPRFVPTLTEVVRLTPAPAVTVGNDTSQPSEAPLSSKSASPALQEEQVVQRVMQRMELVLERRLREAIGQVVLEQTQTLAPRLREELEQMVRESVNQVFLQGSAKLPPHS